MRTSAAVRRRHLPRVKLSGDGIAADPDPVLKMPRYESAVATGLTKHCLRIKTHQRL
jgi:hypothetical protein